MQVVTRIGVKSIDAMTIGAARRIRIALQNELQATESVAYDTARRHIALACERQRQTEWQPPPDGWGGGSGSSARRERFPAKSTNARQRA